MDEKSRKRRYYDWLTNKYQLIIRNEENFEETTSISFNYVKAFSVLFITLAVLLFLSLFLAKFVLAQWYDPEYGERKLRKDLSEIAVQIDSLENELDRRHNFIMALQTMISGGKIQENEDSVNTEIINYKSIAVDDLSPVDKKFREKFEAKPLSTEAENIGAENNNLLQFFPPVIGATISQKYDPNKGHFGIDLSAEPESAVKAIASGTVILAGYTQENGNVIGIQHNNNLISIYKHNTSVFKTVGNKIQAGEAIAIIGNSGENSTGPHLHLEMWYDGRAIDPEKYIAF